MSTLTEVEDKNTKLYKEMVGTYSSYILSKSNESYKRLETLVKRIKAYRESLKEGVDDEALTYLSMWFIDGDGWLNMVPNPSLISKANMSCINVINQKTRITDFMNLDYEYLSPGIHVDKENVEEFSNTMSDAMDNLEKEVNKIENGENEMSENTEKVENEKNVNEEENKSEVKTKLKKYGTYAAIGVAVVAVGALTFLGYKKYTDDGITVIDFGK